MSFYYEFDFIEFAPLIPDGLIPIPSGAMNSGLRHVPYSDSDILDLGGRSARHYSARIRTTIAGYVSMDAALGETATLILGGISYTNATLIRLENTRQTPGGEWCLSDAEWVL